MGGGNPVQQISETVQSVVAPVVQPIQAVIAPVVQPIANSDVGKYVGTLGTDIGNVAKTPYVVAADLASGNLKDAGRDTLKSAGSFANLGSAGSFRAIGEDRLAQGILRNDKLDKATLGLSNDFAGFTSGVSSTRSSGNISSADVNSSLRLGSKIGGAALGFSAYRAIDPITVEGYKQSAILAGSTVGGVKALSKGDIGAAINQFGDTKIGDTVNEYLPGLPAAPTLPSWVPDLSSLYDSIIPTASSGAPGAGSFTPFNQSGASSSDAPPLIQSPEAKTIAVSGVILVLSFIILKKGRK